MKEFPKTEAGVRTIIIPNNYMWVIERAKELNPSGDYVMMKNEEGIKTYSFRKRLYLACNKANVKKKSPHKIRKIIITEIGAISTQKQESLIKYQNSQNISLSNCLSNL